MKTNLLHFLQRFCNLNLKEGNTLNIINKNYTFESILITILILNIYIFNLFIFFIKMLISFMLFYFITQKFKYSNNKFIRLLQILILYKICFFLVFISFNFIDMFKTVDCESGDHLEAISTTESNNTNLEVENKIETISKSSFIISELHTKLREFISTLTGEELLAFGGLLFNGLIVNYTISIIFILYGDYLINKFDLENRYPKLANFIQFRRKLQSYYLKISFFWIFICVLPQIAIYSLIIIPKLIEFFNIII